MGNIDDQHRNTNMNDKDHLVGQLTTIEQDLSLIGLLMNWTKMDKQTKEDENWMKTDKDG